VILPPAEGRAIPHHDGGLIVRCGACGAEVYEQGYVFPVPGVMAHACATCRADLVTEIRADWDAWDDWSGWRVRVE
jgi:hypothetical protein